MRAWPMFLCQVVVALSVAGFVGAWTGFAMIRADALEAPQGVHDRPLQIKRLQGGRFAVRYITARQEALLALLEPALMAFGAVMLAGGVGLSIVSDAERDKNRRR